MSGILYTLKTRKSNVSKILANNYLGRQLVKQIVDNNKPSNEKTQIKIDIGGQQFSVKELGLSEEKGDKG